MSSTRAQPQVRQRPAADGRSWGGGRGGGRAEQGAENNPHCQRPYRITRVQYRRTTTTRPTCSRRWAAGNTSTSVSAPRRNIARGRDIQGQSQLSRTARRPAIDSRNRDVAALPDRRHLTDRSPGREGLAFSSVSAVRDVTPRASTTRASASTMGRSARACAAHRLEPEGRRTAAIRDQRNGCSSAPRRLHVSRASVVRGFDVEEFRSACRAGPSPRRTGHGDAARGRQCVVQDAGARGTDVESGPALAAPEFSKTRDARQPRVTPDAPPTTRVLAGDNGRSRQLPVGAVRTDTNNLAPASACAWRSGGPGRPWRLRRQLQSEPMPLCAEAGVAAPLP